MTMQRSSTRIWREAWSASAESPWSADADILSAAIANRTVAEIWIQRFGNLAGVAAAGQSVLYVIAKQVDPGSAAAVIERLFIIHRYGIRALAQDVAKRPLLEDLRRTTLYLRGCMQAEGVVQLRILFLDAAKGLILDEVMNRGSVEYCAVYPREVIRRALEVYAVSVLIVSNHPWGDPSPLPNEIASTRDIVAAGKALGIYVVDHLIIGRNGIASLQELGLLADVEHRRPNADRRASRF